MIEKKKVFGVRKKPNCFSNFEYKNLEMNMGNARQIYIYIKVYRFWKP